MIAEPQSLEEFRAALHEIKLELSGVHFDFIPSYYASERSWVPLTQDEVSSLIDELMIATETGVATASQKFAGKILLSILERRIKIDADCPSTPAMPQEVVKRKRKRADPK